MGSRGGGNLLPEHLGFSQNMRMRLARGALGGFMGAGAGGLAGLASWCPILPISGLSVVILGPRTEYQPSSSGKRGRLPRVAGNWRRLPSWSKPRGQSPCDCR